MCESPPTIDPRHGNGSTLIAHQVLSRLPHEVELIWFDDRPAAPAVGLLDAIARATRVSIRPATVALAAQPFTRLPRGSWQRTGRRARRVIADASARADVVYLHGLHVFHYADRVGKPVVVNEVDPWSDFWRERAARRPSPLARAYDNLQASRADALERHASAAARRYVVVNALDAADLAARLGRTVDVLSNGATMESVSPRPRTNGLIAFAGSLDYAPNVEAAETLVRRVLPVVASVEPGMRAVLAGRRPSERVWALASDVVTVLPDVPDLGAVLATAPIAAFAGSTGRGMKNSVLEAMAAGCAVVAHPGSLRGLAPGAPVEIAADETTMAQILIRLLRDPDAAASLGERARQFAMAWPSWDEVAAQYSRLLESAAG